MHHTDLLETCMHGKLSENVLKKTFDKAFCNTSLKDNGSGTGSDSGESNRGVSLGKEWSRIDRNNGSSTSGQDSVSGEAENPRNWT